MVKDLTSFIEGDYAYFIDAMAQRYNVLPSDLLYQDMDTFHINSIIFFKAFTNEIKQREKENKQRARNHGHPVISGDRMSFNEFNIKRNKNKKETKHAK